MLCVSSPGYRHPLTPRPITASSPGSCILLWELHPSPREPSLSRGTASHLPELPIPAGWRVPPRRIGAKAKAKGEGGSGHAGYVRRRRRAAGKRHRAPAGALSPPARRLCRRCSRRRPMERPLLPLLCGTVAFLLSWAAADTGKCLPGVLIPAPGCPYPPPGAHDAPGVLALLPRVATLLPGMPTPVPACPHFSLGAPQPTTRCLHSP